MDRSARRQLEGFRRTAGPVENTFVDEALSGEMDRGEFLRRGTMFGLSASVLGGLLAAMGEAPLAFAQPQAATPGGRIRLGVNPPPTAPIEPHLFADTGSLETGSICGEFLNRNTPQLTNAPELAVSWAPNADASIWTYKLRQGVSFQNGQPFGADDVIATYDRLTNPKTNSQALSAFKGVLSPGGTRKIDDHTVAFHLDQPSAAFPYLTSSTTYQAIILPANYKLGTFTSTPQTTGAFKLVSYTPGVGAKYDRFDGWWGGSAPLDGVDVTYYSSSAAVDSALLGGGIDLITQVSPATDRPMFQNKNVQIFVGNGAAHKEIPMRVDQPPFNDYRIRQAVALALGRPGIIRTLWAGYANLGDDSPFAPAYPSTVELFQRKKNLRKARQLLEGAHQAQGFKVKLTFGQNGEIAELAQIVQRAVRAIHIDMPLQSMGLSQYYGGTPSSTPWLNAPIDITNWGHRSVPNIFLTAAFMTGGQWNAAHYSSKKLDSLARSYIAAISLKDQRHYAEHIQLQLLHDTPVVIPYFYDHLAAASKRVHNYFADPASTVYLSKTYLSQ